MSCVAYATSGPYRQTYATGIPTVIDEIGRMEYANGTQAIGACTWGAIGVRIWVECEFRVVV